MKMKEFEGATRCITWLKLIGATGVVVGAIILIGSILILGAVIGRVEAPFLEYVIPTEVAKVISGVGIFIGVAFVIDGVAVIYCALRIEKVLRRPY